MTSIALPRTQFPLYEHRVRSKLEDLISRVFSAPFAKTFSAPLGGAAAVSKLLINDTFIDTNGTLLSAHTIAPTNVPVTSWTKVGGATLDNYQIQSNRVRVEAANLDLYYLCNPGLADGVITCDFTAQSTGYDVQGLYYRSVDTSNWCRAVYEYFGASKNLYLQEKTAGSVTTLGTATITIARSTTYTMTLTLNGSGIVVTFSDGTLSATSATRQTTTIHGVNQYTDNALLDGYLDNFTFTAL